MSARIQSTLDHPLFLPGYADDGAGASCGDRCCELHILVS